MVQSNSARNMNTKFIKLGDPVKNSTYITYDELVYILQSRHGGGSERPKTMTPCARAILGCCKDKVMNEYCSESLMCGAYFFDDNPCEDKFILQALEAASKFYDQFNNVQVKK